MRVSKDNILVRASSFCVSLLVVHLSYNIMCLMDLIFHSTFCLCFLCSFGVSHHRKTIGSVSTATSNTSANNYFVKFKTKKIFCPHTKQ